MITHSTISLKEEAILNASLRLFVKFGFHGTPTSKIATEAGIAHGTIFTYFKTKDELVAALYRYVKENLREFLIKKVITEGTIKARFREVFFYSVQWSLANPDEFYFTQQFRYSSYHAKNLTETAVKERSLHREIYEEGLEAGVFRKLSLDMIAELSMSQMVGMYHFLCEGKFSDSEAKKLINEAFNGLWRMFAKD